MTDNSTTKSTDNEDLNVHVSNSKKLPAVWIIPLVALLIGIWMILNHYLTRGPEIYITFPTAEGIESGKTKIKALSVDIGIVNDVQLNEDLKSVTVNASIDHEAESLLRDDAQFWVVRPRIGTSGVSGLNTLLSGAYIELAPGTGKEGKRDFQGLDEAPITPASIPGLHLTLLSEDASSVGIGDPVLYRGYKVGRVENTKLAMDTQKLQVSIFIESPYDGLITNHTRFWNSSGISFQASASGVTLQTSSIESLLIGGVSFDLPDGSKPGEKAKDFDEFTLYPDATSINENPYQFYKEYLLLFDSSVRGLVAGAPVLYRGLRIGTVMGISFNYLHIDKARTKDRSPQIPVLIRLEPGRWLDEDSLQAKSKAVADVTESVSTGMRASLTTGNLLTGALVVTFDFYDDVEPASIEKIGNYDTIPTISKGLVEIQVKIVNLLDKLNSLPLNSVLQDTNSTLNQITKTLASADQTVKELNSILKNSNTQQLPESIVSTLDELKQTLQGLSPNSSLYLDLSSSIEQLNATLKNVENLTQTIENKPNSLIFSKPIKEDTQPRAAE